MKKKRSVGKRERISMDKAMEKLADSNSDFRSWWEEGRGEFGDQARFLMLIIFPNKICEFLMADRRYDFRGLLRVTEEIARDGEESVQEIICTVFIEAILHVSDDFPYVMAPVLRSLGPVSRKYACDYNEFFGRKNKGLEE